MEIENEITGNRVRFTKVPTESGSGSLAFEVAIAPGFAGRLFELERRRPEQTLSITVLEGELAELSREDDPEGQRSATTPNRFSAGERIEITGGATRRFRNGLEASATRVAVEISPPLDTYQFIIHGYDIARRRVESIPDSAAESNADSVVGSSDDDHREAEPPLQKLSEDTVDEVHKPAIPKPSVVQAARAVWRDIHWSSLLVGGFLCLLSGVIFVMLVSYFYLDSEITTIEGIAIWALTLLSLSPVFGYLVRTSRNVHYGYPPLPRFKNLSPLLIDGVMLSMILLVYLTLPLYAIFTLLGPLSVLILPLALQYEWVMPLLTVVASSIAYYVFPAAYFQYVETEQLRSVLDRKSLQRTLWRRSYLVGHLRLLGAYVALAIAFAFVMIVPLVGLVVVLLSPFLLFLVLVGTSVFLGTMWKAISAERASEHRSPSRLALFIRSLGSGAKSDRP
ncbi:DUF4013 domain-containing protein [Natronorarus salvus]|uniref:DUF4013 domain-containing protein n=1 Tax=Natronorarus salvus TaxID=3117733 RepID=UPI002F26C295